jgi:pimeloyl-ACP methyl ester carboxylesterase
MSSAHDIPTGLHFVTDSPVPGLAVAQRRVKDPLACVIFIHGALDRGGSFARVARRMENFNVLTYDRRGYQGSRGLVPFDFDRHVDDLLALAARESSNGPVVYFGHSFGGTIALGAAIREPALVKVAIAYEAPLPWLLERTSARPKFSHDPGEAAELFFRARVSESAWERLSVMQRQSRRLDGPALLNDLSILRKGLVPFDLADLRVPALYAHGNGVNAPYFRELDAKLTALNPLITTRELAHAEHGAHLSIPDQLAQLILETWQRACTSA